MAKVRKVTSHVACQGHNLKGRGKVFRKGVDVTVDSLGRVTLRRHGDPDVGVDTKIGRRDWDAIVEEVDSLREQLVAATV